MLRQGATATMEAWSRSIKPNLSWSHPWCAGPNSVIVRHLLGVQPIGLGWARMQFAPQPSTLRTINATVPSRLGAIIVTIDNTPEAFRRPPVPTGTTARVRLPPPQGSSPASATVLELDGVTADSNAEGRMRCLRDDVPPGSHAVSRHG